MYIYIHTDVYTHTDTLHTPYTYHTPCSPHADTHRQIFSYLSYLYMSCIYCAIISTYFAWRVVSQLIISLFHVGTTLQPVISTIDASASDIQVTYRFNGTDTLSNAARADHDRLRSLTVNYKFRSMMGTFDLQTVSAQTVSRVGSQIVATFPVPSSEELQPFLVYIMNMFLSVRGEAGPMSDTTTFSRSIDGESLFMFSNSMSTCTQKPGDKFMIGSTGCL